MSNRSAASGSVIMGVMQTPIRLIGERAKDWARRSDKWHAALGRERQWSQAGIALPPVIFALATFLLALGLPRPPLVTALAGLLASIITLRAHFGRQRLEADRTELAWVTADRMAEAYRSLVLRAGSRESPTELLRVSDLMEARARFGLPPELLEPLERAAAPEGIDDPIAERGAVGWGE